MRYLLSVAPVYRGGFPVYGSYVSIPEKRAVRLTSETVSLLDSNGRLCLGQSSRTRSLKEGIENSLIEVRTTVKYQGTKDEKTFTGIKNTVPLNDVKGKTFTVTSRARYRIPIVEKTQCRQVEKKVSGTMIQLYEHNPNAAGLISIDLKLIFASIMRLRARSSKQEGTDLVYGVVGKTWKKPNLQKNRSRKSRLSGHVSI
ncbi:hypothetical protein ABFA07_014957 [Porites harrisoni]